MATHKRVNTFVDKRPKPAKKLKKQKLLDGESTPSEAEVMVKLEPDCNAIPGAGAKQRLRNDGNESNCVNQEHDRDKASSMLFHVLNKEFTAALVPEMEKTVFEKKTKIKKVKHKPKCGTENKLPSKQRPETSNKMTMTIIKEEEKEDSNNGVTVKLEPVSDTEEELPVFFERKEDLSRFRQSSTFLELISGHHATLVAWLQGLNILPCRMLCSCGEECRLRELSNADGFSWRCSQRHKTSIRKNSFFERTHFGIHGILLFIKLYLDRFTLLQISVQTGMSYANTAVQWAAYIREIFKEYFHKIIQKEKFSGIVEVKESLFGKKRTYKNAGLNVWIIGLIERSTNRLICYPVENQDRDLTHCVIRRHVIPGSTLYMDSGGGCLGLHDYIQFEVEKADGLRLTYRNFSSGEMIEVDSQPEDSWSSTKEHFARIHGTLPSHLEGHLCEIMWRCRNGGDGIYENFFRFLRTVYTCDAPPKYTYPSPVFFTWKLQEKKEQ